MGPRVRGDDGRMCGDATAGCVVTQVSSNALQDITGTIVLADTGKLFEGEA